MSLESVESIDVFNYLTTGNFSSSRWMNVDGVPDPRMGTRYYDRLDILYVKADSPGGGAYIMDPLFIDNTNPMFRQFDANENDFSNITIGQLDRLANSQRIYQHNSSTPNDWDERNPLLPEQVIAAAPWPNAGIGTCKTAAPGAVGYFDEGSGGGSVLLLDGAGYEKALHFYVDVVDTDVVEYQRVMALQDLNTGLAEIVPISVDYGNTTHKYGEPTLFGDTVTFRNGQFIADDDSLSAAPKGFLFMHSYAVNAGGNFRFNYVKITDWNPNAAGGSPVRIHGRTRLLTRYRVEQGQFPGQVDGVVTYLNERCVYHPPTRKILHPTTVSSPGPTLGAAEQGFLKIPTTPALALLTKPTARTTIETNRIVTFSSDARGDLNEPISGTRVAYTLERISTLGEVLAVTPTPGESVPCTQTPMDAAPAEPTVYEDGVPLTGGGADYNFTRSPASIDFVAPKPLAGGEVYTVDYFHEADPASPPHGRLLNVNGQSDETGETAARVEYLDDDTIVDQRDRIQVDTV